MKRAKKFTSNRSRWRQYSWAVRLGSIFAIGAFLFAVAPWVRGATGTLSKESREREVYKNLESFTEVLWMIRQKYVDPSATDPEKLIQGALAGMVSQLDPYSSYMDPQSFTDMRQGTEGEFGGLGIEISVRGGQLTVVTPIEGTPADKVGLEAGDRIIQIEGESTESIQIMEAVHKLRGPKGSKVNITVARDGYGEPFHFSIIRGTIRSPGVRWQTLADGAGYLRISEFTRNTTEDMAKAMKNFDKAKITGLILDLRNNPGGLLDKAVEVTDFFLAGGQTIVSTEGRIRGSNRLWTSHDKPAYTELPLIILVNGGSASGSEIVAGALQDLKRGLLMGNQTFGKGSVQNIMSLPKSKGAALRLTTAYYFTPLKQKIHGHGIKPDILMEDHLLQRETIKMSSRNTLEKFAAHWLEQPELKVKTEKEKTDVTHSVFMEYIDFLRDQGLRPDEDKLMLDKVPLMNAIEAELVRQTFDEAEARNTRVENDVWVLRAQELIRAANLMRSTKG